MATFTFKIGFTIPQTQSLTRQHLALVKVNHFHFCPAVVCRCVIGVDGEHGGGIHHPLLAKRGGFVSWSENKEKSQ